MQVNNAFISDSSDSSNETVKIPSCGSPTDLSPSPNLVSFTASATIIAMTMSVFEFSQRMYSDHYNKLYYLV